MFDTLINIIRKSDEVMAARVSGSQPVTVEGEKFVRAAADVVEMFKAGTERPKTINYDVEFANKETPQTTEGKTYVLFLRKGKDGKEAGRRFLVDLSRPLGVPEERKDAYFQLIREYVAVAEGEAAKKNLKAHLLKVLQCGIPFFQEDAAKTALLVTDWTPQEVEKIKEILAGAGRTSAPEGNERDNLAALVLSLGTATQALAQGRLEFARGNADGVYYGLNRRKGADVDAMLGTFLKDADAAVRLGALRVAGLLRKGDVLDKFEEQNRNSLDEKTRSALSEARKLVSRD
ncbi:MAG TPA: hypothetical protein VGQ99_08425 [Tepidisphaeraceae bacterium]|jgi:hypothetical protein|nr:hypothetical protein [Tepidisphaeraceae bacterium]